MGDGWPNHRLKRCLIAPILHRPGQASGGGTRVAVLRDATDASAEGRCERGFEGRGMSPGRRGRAAAAVVGTEEHMTRKAITFFLD